MWTIQLKSEGADNKRNSFQLSSSVSGAVIDIGISRWDGYLGYKCKSNTKLR